MIFKLLHSVASLIGRCRAVVCLRLALLAGAFFATFNIGDYRKAVVRWDGAAREWNDIRRIDFVEGAEAVFTGIEQPEMRNAFLLMRLVRSLRRRGFY